MESVTQDTANPTMFPLKRVLSHNYLRSGMACALGVWPVDPFRSGADLSVRPLPVRMPGRFQRQPDSGEIGLHLVVRRGQEIGSLGSV